MGTLLVLKNIWKWCSHNKLVIFNLTVVAFLSLQLLITNLENKHLQTENSKIQDELITTKADLEISKANATTLESKVDKQNSIIEMMNKDFKEKQQKLKDQLFEIKKNESVLQKENERLMGIKETGDQCKDVHNLLKDFSYNFV